MGDRICQRNGGGPAAQGSKQRICGQLQVERSLRAEVDMLKNLTDECFRGTTRQNELIEIALTNHFDTIDVDMGDMHDRAAAMGKKFACQFIKSATIRVGCFDLPIDVAAEQAEYDKESKRIEAIVDLAKEIRATRCRLEISSTGGKVFHENFELVRQRIAALADTFAAAGVSIGLSLQRDPSQRRYENMFVQKGDELLTLIKMVGKKNVGLALDTCSWRLGGGSLDSLRKLSATQWIDVQLCDPAPHAQWSNATATSRCLPGNDDSFHVELIKHLAKLGYEGPIAATAHPSQLGGIKPAAMGARMAEALNGLLARAEALPAEVAAG
jgi:sugar phosphate isomerase/epimerase